jgi:hypothetical protein
MKYGLNKIKIKLFTQEVGWLGGPKIKFHKWHSLWSTLKYLPNISYLLKPPRLGGYLGELK